MSNVHKINNTRAINKHYTIHKEVVMSNLATCNIFHSYYLDADLKIKLSFEVAPAKCSYSLFRHKLISLADITMICPNSCHVEVKKVTRYVA